MNKKAFINAVAELGTEKGLSKEIITQSIEEAFKISVNKKLSEELKIDNKVNKPIKKVTKEGEPAPEIKKLPNALIRIDCDLDKAKINVYYQRLVKLDEEIEDDFLEISLDEAKEKDPKIKLGDYYEEEIDLDTFDKKDVDRFVSTFKQSLAKAEKAILLETFKDKIGHLVTGVVEKADNTCVIVNLGRTSVTLFQKNLIGDEKFNTGDPIKVYIQGIGKDDKKSALIQASRSCPEFLEKIFENEVNEIYDKTVEIVKIARIAGKRSKVVVYSHDPNVDASGACIGKSGERIQRIVSQLGNSKDSKEKIDVVLYHKNLGVYLAEILKPGEVLGINFSEDMKHATVICKNDTMKLAVGSQGQNVILAKKLTDLETIEIINDSDMAEKGITNYKSLEAYILEDQEEEKEEAKRKFREENIKQTLAKKQLQTETTEFVPEFSDEELDEEFDEEEVETPELSEKIVDKEEIKEEVKTEKVEETKEEVKEIPEEKIEEKPVKKVEPVELKEVKTTTTLESLEKSLEEEKKSKETKVIKKSNKKKDEKTEETKAEEKKTIKKMDVYTEEELAAFEEEEMDEDLYEDDEEDWSDYDSDDLYEDK